MPAAKARNFWGTAIALLLFALPNVVRACPMCFNSGKNEDAFLYGSLFMMVVPTVAIGGLLYWGYRRIKALESGQTFRSMDDETPPPSDDVETLRSGEAVVLRMRAVDEPQTR